MDTWELVILSCGLAMDACAVAAAKGLNCHYTWRQALLLCGVFGLFQAVMPAIGWGAGLMFRELVMRWAPWIAFTLLVAIGGKMAWEGWRGGGADEERCDPFAPATVLLLALATSIDALAVGVGLSLLHVDLVWSVTVIGVTTLVLSLAAMHLGRCAGRWLAGGLDLLGGVILVGIGTRILVAHLMA
jgi:putative Mn2+ efflux pump MntP